MNGRHLCLGCTKPCTSEGQLCPDCVSSGMWVDDDNVYVTLTLNT